IDRLSNVTIGAGMVVSEAEPVKGGKSLPPVTAEARARRLGQQAARLVISGEDSLALATQLERVLFAAGALPVVVGSDESVLAGRLQAAGLLVIQAGEADGARRLQILCGPNDIALSSLESENETAAETVLAALREHRI